MLKNSVFWAFCTNSHKKCVKTVFFHVFRDTLYKVRKNAKNSVFSNFLHVVPQKVWENSVFSRFSRHFEQSSQKMRKKTFFWAFCMTSQKKCEKTVFFYVFRGTQYKVCKKWIKKQCFLSFLHVVQLNKCEKLQFFFTFFEAPCTKFA